MILGVFVLTGCTGQPNERADHQSEQPAGWDIARTSTTNTTQQGQTADPGNAGNGSGSENESLGFDGPSRAHGNASWEGPIYFALEGFQLDNGSRQVTLPWDAFFELDITLQSNATSIGGIRAVIRDNGENIVLSQEGQSPLALVSLLGGGDYRISVEAGRQGVLALTSYHADAQWTQRQAGS